MRNILNFTNEMNSMVISLKCSIQYYFVMNKRMFLPFAYRENNMEEVWEQEEISEIPIDISCFSDCL